MPPITGTCPTCGTKAPIESYLMEEKYKRAFREALAMPATLAELVLPYLGLFAPASGRAMRADKLNRVVRELRDLVTSGQVTRKRITHAAPQDLWKYGLEQTLAARDYGSLELPLDDHNYLCTIVWRAANKGAARQEQQAETKRSQRSGPAASQPVSVKKLVEKAQTKAGINAGLTGLKKAAESATDD